MSQFDVILYGATGFTGKQTARYFAAHAPPGLRWAVAGRDPARLDEIAGDTNANDVVVADAGNPAAIDAMVGRTRVLLTTAGPYAKYGSSVVDACARRGVDYVDITGEVAWVEEMIGRHHRQATERGTRIVPFCGFDSIPADLGTLLLVDHLKGRDEQTRSVSASYKMKGGLNGGTLDSALTMAERGQVDTAALRRPTWDPVRKTWLAPFVMSVINTRVVQRSAAMAAETGYPYGPGFTYEESMETGKRGTAWAIAGGLQLFAAVTKSATGRALVRRFGPRPGAGPSEAAMDGGFFRTRLVAEGTGGTRLQATLSFQGDPGNRFTVTALCESALLLARDRGRLPGGPKRGGILTPATGLGLPLLERLQQRGLEIAVTSA